MISGDAADQARGAQTGKLIEEFGAAGDGRQDDTAAFERALATTAPGGSVALSGGRTYRLTRSLVFTRPLVVTGGTRENTQLAFDDGNYAVLGGLKAALVLPHDRTRPDHATARRSALSGFSVSWIGRSEPQLHGLLIATPVYLSELEVRGFPGNGFHVEAETRAIKGNANGTSFTNCSSRENRGDGFVFHGNDANACLLIGARAFDNFGNGFRDDSLLGNVYLGCEVDGNQKGGFTSTKQTPNRSLYLGCYAEPNQLYDLNERNLVLGSLGHLRGDPTATVRALPSAELFSGSNVVFARTESVAAEVVGVGTEPRLRIGKDGLDLTTGDGQRIRLTKSLSSNYVDILNGDLPVLRIPSRSVAGNITAARPWLPAGLALGNSGNAGIVGAGPRPPSNGRFSAGALWLNETPSAGAYAGWVCVVAGEPGEWLPFGRIEGAAKASR